LLKPFQGNDQPSRGGSTPRDALRFAGGGAVYHFKTAAAASRRRRGVEKRQACFEIPEIFFFSEDFVTSTSLPGCRFFWQAPLGLYANLFQQLFKTHEFPNSELNLKDAKRIIKIIP